MTTPPPSAANDDPAEEPTDIDDLLDQDLDDPAPHISELRLVIEANDLSAALKFYRDALGLPIREGYAAGDAAQLVLDAGRASIELVHPELPTSESDADSLTEVHSPPAPKIRLAFRSENPAGTISSLEEADAERVTPPRLTSSGAITARFVGPDHMPITVYQPLSGPDFAEDPAPVE